MTSGTRRRLVSRLSRRRWRLASSRVEPLTPRISSSDERPAAAGLPEPSSSSLPAGRRGRRWRVRRRRAEPASSPSPSPASAWLAGFGGRASAAAPTRRIVGGWRSPASRPCSPSSPVSSSSRTRPRPRRPRRRRRRGASLALARRRRIPPSSSASVVGSSASSPARHRRSTAATARSRSTRGASNATASGSGAWKVTTGAARRRDRRAGLTSAPRPRPPRLSRRPLPRPPTSSATNSSAASAMASCSATLGRQFFGDRLGHGLFGSARLGSLLGHRLGRRLDEPAQAPALRPAGWRPAGGAAAAAAAVGRRVRGRLCAWPRSLSVLLLSLVSSIKLLSLSAPGRVVLASAQGSAQALTGIVSAPATPLMGSRHCRLPCPPRVDQQSTRPPTVGPAPPSSPRTRSAPADQPRQLKAATTSSGRTTGVVCCTTTLSIAHASPRYPVTPAGRPVSRRLHDQRADQRSSHVDRSGGRPS